MKRRWVQALLAAVLACGVAAGTAAAHDTKELGVWKVTFGMTPEPVFTDQFYKTTWRFVDQEGEPVVGLKDLSVTILKDGKPYGPFAVRAAHGDPGLYETPTIFARAGEYRFVLSGTAPAADSGASFSIEFRKEVLDAAVITAGG